MNRNLSFGPRGWAILTLAGGAALASPFLRPAQLKNSQSSSEQNAGGLTCNPSAYGSGAFESVPAFPADFSDEKASGASQPYQVVLRELPSTAAAQQLPAWASKTSRLDDLISSNFASGELPSATPVEAQRPQEMQPWINDPRQRAQSVVVPSEQSLAVNRHSPWQSSESQADAVEPNLANVNSRYADTNWHVETPDVRALLRETAVASTLAPQESQRPGALVGASLRSVNRSSSNDSSVTHEQHKPKFVFQPGLKHDAR